MGGTTAVSDLHTGTIGTMTNTSTLTVSSPNTGDSISIGTMNGTVDATHLVNYSVNSMGGTTSAGSLDTGTIGTMTNTSTLTVSDRKSVEYSNIGTMNGPGDAKHKVNYSVKSMGGTTSAGSLDTGTIGTMTNPSRLTVSSPNAGDSISIGTMIGTVDATHLVNYSVNSMGGTTSAGSLDTGTIGTMTNTSTLTV